MPAVPPATAAAVMVTAPPPLPRMPTALEPVTLPVAVMVTRPEPVFRASIPPAPVTVATLIVIVPVSAPPLAWIPAVAVPVTVAVALTETDPALLLAALMPIPPPETVCIAVMVRSPPLETRPSMPTPLVAVAETALLASTSTSLSFPPMALIPAVLPVTAWAAVIVRVPAFAPAEPRIPSPVVAVTAPEASTFTAPEPWERASMP